MVPMLSDDGSARRLHDRVDLCPAIRDGSGRGHARRDPPDSAETDRESKRLLYILGKLHGHHIVIACLPTGVYGTISAATVVSHLMSTFLQVRDSLMVGIRGGIPSSSNDIRLGDVVVSKPAGKYSKIIQYDYSQTVQGRRFEQTSILSAPPQVS
ncbi:hypothetical protein EIK77_006679 [Talaromyces pinophilus]|nr:hypothetical protein EIK77_006679 [Talaromyces pinophilus]